MRLSVIKAKRQEGKLTVLVKARDMCHYTLTICKNEKNFPKRDRWILTHPVVNEALSIMTCLRRSNAVRVETQADYDYRRNQQVMAYGHAEALLTLIELAYVTLNLESDRVDHWTGLIFEVEPLIQKWRRSDKERYKAFSTIEKNDAPAFVTEA